MTTPKVNTIKRGGSRFYVHPDTGAKAPGVTSIISMLPKPFLVPWASKMVAEFAVDNLGAVSALSGNDRQAAVDLLKNAPRRNTNTAADAGTDVHDIYDRLAKGEDIGRVHPDLDPYVRNFCEFVDEFEPEFTFTEETVWSEAHDYAGSFDVYATIQGEQVFGDWKTTRSGVYPEVALQLAAYRHADYILRPDGSTIPNPPSTGGFVLHTRPEGWSLVPVTCEQEQFETFLTLRSIFNWDLDGKKGVIGMAINQTPGTKLGRR